MKILHVTPWYEPAWNSGGTAVATSNLCQALAKKGVNITVYTTNDKGEGKRLKVPLNKKIPLNGVNVWYFQCGVFRNWKAAIYSKNLSEKLKETFKTFDLIHVASTRHWHGYMVNKLSKIYGKPYIVTPHASLMDWYIKKVGNYFLKIPYIKAFDKKVIKECSAIHYLCQGEREASNKYDYGAPSFFVPNGIKLYDFKHNKENREKLRKNFNIPENKIILLQLGRIHPVKNIHLIIESLQRFPKNENNIIYCIVGPISDRKYYESLKDQVKQFNLQNKVRFYPPIDKNEVSQWYSFSDLMVLISEVEGISMSSIEAQAAALPLVVSRNVANANEIIKDNAGVVIDTKIESIINGIRKCILSPKTLKTFSNNALKSAYKRYDIDKVGGLMLEAYENILSGNRSKNLHWNYF